MGILPEKKIETPLRIEEAVEITYADYVFDDSGDEDVVVVTYGDSSSEEERAAVGGGYQRTVQRRSAAADARKAVRQANRAATHHEATSIKKNMGARKWRRVENARILAAFVDPDDVYYDSRDLIENTVSAFSRLMSDEVSMRVWNAFIEQNDEEQSRFLKTLDHEKNLRFNERKGVAVEKKTNNNNDEKRARHPAYSARACFESLDKRFRTAFAKQHVPMRMIEEIEGELRNFFSSKPKGTWSESVDSDYKRFYLHAVAQFLRLKSQSHSEFPRGRVTTVENPLSAFTPPADSLSGFLNRNPRISVK